MGLSQTVDTSWKHATVKNAFVYLCTLHLTFTETKGPKNIPGSQCPCTSKVYEDMEKMKKNGLPSLEWKNQNVLHQGDNQLD